MGVSFAIESIITHPSRRRPGPHQRYIIQQERLSYICKTFQWTKPPWDEPSEVRGVESSANRSRWIPVLTLALYLELYPDEPAALSSNDLVELAIHVEDHHAHMHDTPWPSIKRRRFRHLLNHHENTAYWLPHNFERPQLITTVILEDPGQYDFSIGSSYRLVQEMASLCEICARIVAVRDPLAEVGSRTWNSIQDLCDRIYDAAQESLSLNLPLLIAW